METPLQLYPIRDLVLLPELNPRAQLCEETIIRYMESFDALPPVSIQEGSGVLVDGFHRVEAATRLGVEALPVRMLDIPDEELHLYAGLANCGHGRAMSRVERNRFVVRLVEEFGWPAEKVSRTIGVSPSSVTLAVREHRYNRELSERLGEEVQVVNSSHVQALYRVGDEQRARLLEAVASKTDEEGRPRPLSGAELKNLVDRMEDPTTPAQELQRLFDDPLARPEPPARRRASGEDRRETFGVSSEVDTPYQVEASTREVERYGPLSGGTSGGLMRDEQRAELLERAFAPADDEERTREPRTGRKSERSDRYDSPGPAGEREPRWQDDGAAPWEEEDDRLLSAAERPAPLGLDARDGWGGTDDASVSVAVLERAEGERGPSDALREAERLLCDLCNRVEDAELWEEIRTVRDLVREVAALVR